MKAERIDKVLQELEQIRKWRRERGDLFIEAVLEASKRIKDRYEKWYEKAIAELYKEIELMNELVPYEELEKQKSDLLALEERFRKNKKELGVFVAALEQGSIKSFEEIRIPERDENTVSSIPHIQDIGKQTIDFSVVLEAFSIAREIEKIEASVEKLSRFMMNVIMLTRRLT